MRIVIGSDHAGFALKGSVTEHLRASGHEVDDIGTYSTDPVDYPPICAAVARRVVEGGGERGIVIGGSGQGEAISANKVRGARAALCHDEYTARFARRHNDSNVLSLGARVVATELALDIVDVFFATAFDGGRHVPRIEEIAAIEDEEAARPRGPGGPQGGPESGR
jgi:ribose 5-phosphate isomerase B